LKRNLKAKPTEAQAKAMQKPKQETKLVTALCPRTEREIVISFDTLTREPTLALAMAVWKHVNQALIDHKDIKIPPFLNARFPRNNNLILTTGLNHNNMDYEAYFRSCAILSYR
jgi:hypothetical protein